MRSTKELYLEEHERLTTDMMDATGCDWDEAYDATGDRAYDAMVDRLADIADRQRDDGT